MIIFQIMKRHYWRVLMLLAYSFGSVMMATEQFHFLMPEKGCYFTIEEFKKAKSPLMNISLHKKDPTSIAELTSRGIIVQGIKFRGETLKGKKNDYIYDLIRRELLRLNQLKNVNMLAMKFVVTNNGNMSPKWQGKDKSYAFFVVDVLEKNSFIVLAERQNMPPTKRVKVELKTINNHSLGSVELDYYAGKNTLAELLLEALCKKGELKTRRIAEENISTIVEYENEDKGTVQISDGSIYRSRKLHKKQLTKDAIRSITFTVGEDVSDRVGNDVKKKGDNTQKKGSQGYLKWIFAKYYEKVWERPSGKVLTVFVVLAIPSAIVYAIRKFFVRPATDAESAALEEEESEYEEEAY